MQVQTYLSNLNEFTDVEVLETLKTEFGIKYTLHQTLPLVILNYCQIDSPKTNPIVRECRGLILELGTWNIVARSFDRFFNLGECEDLQKDFDWNDFYALEKVDGSLINFFFYADEWHMATRGSFGESLMENCNFSWQDLFWKTFKDMNFYKSDFNVNYSFTFELCSRYNKIVTDYETPSLYLLNMYDKVYHKFMPYTYTGYLWNLPTRYNFKSIDEVIKHIEDLELNNPTVEGVVLVDKNLNRIKLKNKKYLSLHKMRGESGFTMKNLLPFIIDGETAELLTYYPEIQDKIDNMYKILNDYYIDFYKVWSYVVHIEDQKEFAIELMSHKFNSADAFFTAKKNGIIQECPKKIWTDLVIKNTKLYERQFKKYDKENL